MASYVLRRLLGAIPLLLGVATLIFFVINLAPGDPTALFFNPNVPAEVLNPRNTWSDPAAYDAQAIKLARMFVANFKTFESTVGAKVRSAGPNT